MSQKFTIQNQLKPVEFTGVKLSEASTRKEDSLRWTEIHIYRTDGGNYIIQRIGQSLVFHRKNGSCDTSRGIEISGKQIGESSEPCERCDPAIPEDYDFNPDEVFVHEQSLSSAQVVREADKVHDALVMNGDKRKFSRMSHVATEALQKASALDPELLNGVITPIRVP